MYKALLILLLVIPSAYPTLAQQSNHNGFEKSASEDSVQNRIDSLTRKIESYETLWKNTEKNNERLSAQVERTMSLMNIVLAVVGGVTVTFTIIGGLLAFFGIKSVYDVYRYRGQIEGRAKEVEALYDEVKGKAEKVRKLTEGLVAPKGKELIRSK